VDTWPDGSENGPQQAEAGLSSPRAAFLQSGGQEDGIALQSPAPGRHGTSAGGHGPPLASLRPGLVITAPHHQHSAGGA
jgi:hypothetical protein